jgi:ABC-2 type transport system permease protein
MKTILRYLRLFGVQVRTSLAMGMQYRLDFLIQGSTSILWLAVTLVPLLVVFGLRKTVAGWTYPEALVVAGWFVALKGILEGAITPSLMAVVEHIRKGTLDFVLLKPADAQFLVSTTRFQPWCVVDVLGGVFVIGWAFHLMHTVPHVVNVFGGTALLGAAIAVLYSIWILVISLAFFVVRVDNLTYLFQSVFDAARWPIDVFRGPVRFLFTFVLPLAVMTSYPARALLGTLAIRTGLFSIAGAMLFAWAARQVWKSSIRHYTSASS